jgi:hypothetical protein
MELPSNQRIPVLHTHDLGDLSGRITPGGDSTDQADWPADRQAAYSVV